MALNTSGAIHITIHNAADIPITDYGSRTNPYVVAKLNGEAASGPISTTRTDSIHNGGLNPRWTESYNNKLLLHYPGIPTAGKVPVVIELWNYNRQTGDSLVGTGVIDLAQLIAKKAGGEVVSESFTATLNEVRGGREFRGAVSLTATFGPPLRPAARFILRGAKIFEWRDQLVAGTLKSRDGLLWSVWKSIQKPLQNASLYALRNRSMVTGAVLTGGTVALCILGLLLALLVPAVLLTLLLFPVWILPVSGIALISSPIWIPIVLTFCLSLFAASVFGLLLVLTQPTLRSLARRSLVKFSESPQGNRLLFEQNFQ